MPLEPGRKLLHYRLLEKLGEGGMGVVYLAEDTKLKRQVALKVLAPRMARDPDRLKRFQREAEAVAALSHPNIVTIFSVEQADDVHFLTMELVEGKSLDQLIPPDGMDLDQFFDLALPLADAIAFAHDRGITHRDLKPANVLVGESGRVQVLDFGLAKLAASTEADPAAARPTVTETRHGTVLGTLPYMSPQQIEGLPVDHRSDVFSLGILFHEMLCGERPFKGASNASLAASILRDEPSPVTELKAGLPGELARILRNCLAKSPEDRYATSRALLAELTTLRREVQRSDVTPPPSRAPGVEDTATERSIAVLPFSNLSADPDNEYFCDGLAEELINALSKIGRLRVIARATAFSLKGEKLDLPAIGKKLGVETVLEGSVRKAGERVRITTRLSNAEDGYQLWSERYDRKMDDIFAIQDEISLAVAERLRLELLGEEKSAVVRRYTDNIEAYHLYLKGRYFIYTRKGLEYFRRAIEIDPSFAPAYAGLAESYSGIGLLGILPPDKFFLKAKTAAEKALAIDDSLDEAHCALAQFKFWLDHDWVGAERNLRRAIELNPRYAPAHCWFANLLAFHGDSDRAVEEIMIARDLDPLSPLIQAMVGWVLYTARRCDEAIEYGRVALEIDPNCVTALYLTALPYKEKLMYDEAVSCLRKAVQVTGRVPFFLALLAHVLGVAGRETEAREIAAELQARSSKEYVSPLFSAWIHLGLGEHEHAVDWFEKAFEAGYAPYHLFLGDSVYDPIRSHPRFKKILEVIGLERWAEEP